MNILEKANEIAGNKRSDEYGHPIDNARRFCDVAKGLGHAFQPEDFPLLMIAVKLSRIGTMGWHEDSYLDIAGYVRVAEMIHEKQLAEDDEGDAKKAIKETVEPPK